MSDLLADFFTECRQALADQHQISRWVIGYSGGLDSTVLLALAAQIFPTASLHALHIHHQLQSEADAWAAHCQAFSKQLGVPCTVIHVQPEGRSENAARDARYQAFTEWLEPSDCLLLGHHAGDQSETLLYRLIRGAGVNGLCGIPATRGLGQAMLLRPLLAFSRSQLEGWAREQGLDWIEDPSNQHQHYDRNFLRHQVLDPLRERWSHLDRRLSDTATMMTEARDLLEQLARQDLLPLQSESGALDLSGLRQLAESRQHNLLRYWVGQSGYALNRKDLLSIRQQFLESKEDAQPQLRLGRSLLRRYRQQLFLLQPDLASRSVLAPAEVRIALDRAVTLELAGGVLEVVPGSYAALSDEAGLSSEDLPQLLFAYRAGGEVLCPLGKGFSVSLKQLFQDAGVPPWLRQEWPLLMLDGQIAAVPGICNTELLADFAGLNFIWRPFSLSGRPFFVSL
ncbi:tRNA lysidine(34) synthetase TilS [Nitrincola sp. MINF-07-Sa-05]|uniref:tRNA lysidine(34) synthetase TilS n=1 Tax=Nitrincola salilacus TaxID=3400273 RepID=UPI003917CFAB